MSTQPEEPEDIWNVEHWLRALEVNAGQRVDPSYEPLADIHVWAFQTRALRMLQQQIQHLVLALNPTMDTVNELRELQARILLALDAHGPAGIAAEVDSWLRSRNGDS